MAKEKMLIMNLLSFFLFLMKMRVGTWMKISTNLRCNQSLLLKPTVTSRKATKCTPSMDIFTAMGLIMEDNSKCKLVIKWPGILLDLETRLTFTLYISMVTLSIT